MTTEVTPRLRNPYVGPQSFRRGDRIYGREREAADLLDLLVAERIVVLHSPSGAGKTSLVQARLIPLLEDEGFDVLPIVRVNRPAPEAGRAAPSRVNRYVLSTLLSIEEGLPPASQHSLAELEQMSLAQYFEQRPATADLPDNELLVFDQFEEVITADPVDQEAKAAFFADLGVALGDRRTWALFVIREDFLAELDPYVRVVPTHLSTRYRLDLLTANEALDAVILPAQAAGVEFDHDAAQKLVDDLRRVRVQRGTTVMTDLGPYVEPVQLQVVCHLVWERLAKDAQRIEITDVEAIGDVDLALAAYYADCVAAAASATGMPERSIRDWVEDGLITAHGFRGQVIRGPGSAGESGQPVLRLLTDRHLLRSESRRGAVWYELAHDRLVEPIQHDNEAWRAAHLSTFERRATEWEAENHPDRLLLTAQELLEHQTAESGETQPLTEIELEFLTASRTALAQAEKVVRANARTRRWLVVSVVGCVLALVAAGLAIGQTVRAGGESTRAAHAALVGQGLGALTLDNELAMLLGQRAAAMKAPATVSQTWESENLLQLALDATPVVRTLSGPERPGVTAAFSADGQRIGTVDEDGMLHIWDATTGRLLASRPGIARPHAMTLSPDGDRLAVVGTDGRVAVWDTSAKDAFLEVNEHQGDVRGVAFSPDGRLVASAGEDGTVRLVDVATGREQRVLSRKSPVYDVQWAEKGSKLLAVDGDGTLAGWSLGSFAPIPDQRRHYAAAVTLDVSPDGSRVATGARDGKIVIQGLASSAKAVSVQLDRDIVDVSFTSDARRLLALDAYGIVWVLDSTDGAKLRTIWEPGTYPLAVESDPTNVDRAIVATGEGDAAVWNVTEGHVNDPTALDITADGNVVTASGDGTVRLWSMDAGQAGVVGLRDVTRSPSDPDHTRAVEPVLRSAWRITDAAVDPNGRYVVTVDALGLPVVTATATSKPPPQLDTKGLDDIDFGAVAVSPTGKYIATGDASGDYDVRLWDAATGDDLFVLSGHRDAITELRFGASDNELVSISRDDTARVWDLAKRKARLELPGNESVTQSAGTTLGGPENQDFNAVAWSPAKGSATRLVATAIGPRVQLWSADTGALVRVLQGHTDRVSSLEFDATGDRLISTSDDHTAVVWDAASGQAVRRIRHGSWITAAAFLGDGDRVVLIGAERVPTVVWLEGDALVKTAKQRTTRELSSEECEQFEQLLGEDWGCGPTATQSPSAGANATPTRPQQQNE